MTVEYVRVGADPELFIKHVTSKQIIPVCGLIGGTKETPIVWDDLNVRNNEEGKYAYQEDGVAFEFNIPAATSADKFTSNMRMAWQKLKSMLEEKGFEPQVKADHRFKESQLSLFPQANTVGCMPDMSAYGETGPEKRNPFDIGQFGDRRFAGGHLHLGYNKKIPPHVIVKFLDVLLGLPSLINDKQGMRRQFYGLPGLYREKPYGVEYRTLSNYWVRSAIGRGDYLHMIAGTLFDLGLTAQARPDVLANAYKMIPWEDVRDAITQENNELGKEIFDYAVKVAKLPARFAGDLWRMSPEGKVL
jgi:hypothetical protein